MWFAKRKAMSKKVEHMEKLLKESFSKVKEDMENTHAWINHLDKKNDEAQEKITTTASSALILKDDFSEIAKENERYKKHFHELSAHQKELTRSVKSLHAYSTKLPSSHQFNFHIEKISQDMNKMDKKIEELSFLKPTLEAVKDQLHEHLAMPHTSTQVEKKIEEIQDKLKQFMVKKSPKEKLVQKVTKNTHDYVKAVVVSYIQKYQKVSGTQLREMVVEEQNLTSKSTFYRILEEIEKRDDVSVIKQGKEKLYLAKARKIA